MFSNEIKEVLDNYEMSELEEVVIYCVDRIEAQKAEKARIIKQKIAELQAELDEVEPPPPPPPQKKNGNQTYKPVVNPDNPSQVYKGTGPKPDWMKNGSGQ